MFERAAKIRKVYNFFINEAVRFREHDLNLSRESIPNGQSQAEGFSCFSSLREVFVAKTVVLSTIRPEFAGQDVPGWALKAAEVYLSYFVNVSAVAGAEEALELVLELKQ